MSLRNPIVLRTTYGTAAEPTVDLTAFLYGAANFMKVTLFTSHAGGVLLPNVVGSFFFVVLCG